MDNTQYDKIISEFFQIFSDSIKQTLSQALDADVCTQNLFSVKYTSKSYDLEPLKSNNAICKLEYALGTSQGVLALLIPEEIVAIISDVLTGGNGKDVYRGSLSEIEINSISKILEKGIKLSI